MTIINSLTSILISFFGCIICYLKISNLKDMLSFVLIDSHPKHNLDYIVATVNSDIQTFQTIFLLFLILLIFNLMDSALRIINNIKKKNELSKLNQ